MESISRLISVAPMLDWTDKHCRYFFRLISPDILLYTEMIVAQAIIKGDVNYLLNFNRMEHPLALQIGGNDPQLLAECASIAESFGYDEVNLNVGCPSPRVSTGQFGACLMSNPQLVARCVLAMQQKVKIPVTVKCRIGVDDQDSYENLHQFVSTVTTDSGCHTFIIHARKAWLKGLSPKQNRDIPPLQYDKVYRLKQDFPSLTIVINGGIQHLADINLHLSQVDGVMIGRAVYNNPYLLADIQQSYYPNKTILTRLEIMEAMFPYINMQLKSGAKLSHISRHLLSLFQGLPGAAAFRRYISQHICPNANIEVLQEALTFVT